MNFEFDPDDYYEKTPARKRSTKRKTSYKGATTKQTSGFVPHTENQKKLWEAMNEASQVLVLGPAGTGKTYVTATYAADEYITKRIDKIVITRPHVAVGKDLGFLPGSLQERPTPGPCPS